MVRTRLRPLVAGNWKMNGLQASVAELRKILAGASKLADGVEILVCPPATLLELSPVRSQCSRIRVSRKTS